MNLDEMLSQPLPDVPDNGFTARVIVRVQREERRKAIAIVVAAIASVTLLCLLVPMPDYSADIGVMLMQLAMSPLVAVAAAALVVTYLIDRVLNDRQLIQLW